MPDQPDDPLHYEMKIPPEPHKDDDSDSEKTAPGEKSEKSETGNDSNVSRGADKSQTERRP